jgi:prophage regulatory protein
VNRILRLERVLDRYGKRRSATYSDIQSGLFVKPVKLGRVAGWPEREVEALIIARIAGSDDNAIRKLVAQLHEARKRPLPTAA